MLDGKTVIGTVHPVQVYLAAALVEPRSKPERISQVTSETTKTSDSTWDLPLDLSHLSDSRKQIV